MHCLNGPPSLTMSHLLGQGVDEQGGMMEGWRGRGREREREERRQNDGVAIKYTAGSEEHAAGMLLGASCLTLLPQEPFVLLILLVLYILMKIGLISFFLF